MTLGAVVVDVQHVDLCGGEGLELSIGGSDLQGVAVLSLPVQGLLQDQTPLTLLLLDDGELPQRVPVCTTQHTRITWLTRTVRQSLQGIIMVLWWGWGDYQENKLGSNI